jgi:DNA-binding NtrC family response regulator
MQIYLTRQGYDVTACRSASSAWERFAVESANYSLVIVDMTLNGMSAEAFIAKVSRENPRVGVLAISGYPGALDKLRESHNERVAYLQKPFTPAMLTEAVNRITQSRSRTADQ